MLSGGRGIDGLDRLDVRLVALLGLALLPIGLIAMVQTYRVIHKADQHAEAALTGATLSAATMERESLLRVRGAAQMAASLLPTLLQDSDCSGRLADFVDGYGNIAFAGFIDTDGFVVCSSDGTGTKLESSAVYQDFLVDPRPGVHAVLGQISGQSVVIITEPVRQGDVLMGYVALSVPQQRLEVPGGDQIAGLRPIRTATFSAEGQLLSGLNNREELLSLLPADQPLQALASNTPTSFRDYSAAGGRRFYTVAPLIPNEIYVLAIWPGNAVRTTGLTAASAILFPLLMWLVSIAVAYFAVHRLVVRHIRYLRLRIRAFTANRRILDPHYSSDTPSDLREVIETFHQMTERIVRDEADLENSLHEKDVLLKEVHHRVKNNLQLIASMISMQLRKSSNTETRFILRRLQDRILGLATIHRNLYQATVLSRVNSSQLIEELVTQSVRNSDASMSGVEVRVEVDEVPLYPDQAVPLSLLVTETITNALKYVGRPKEGAPWIELSLRSIEGGEVQLRVANSTGEPVSEAAIVSTGLGTQLMNAFSMQLDAKSNIEAREDAFVVTVVFRPSEFAEEP